MSETSTITVEHNGLKVTVARSTGLIGMRRELARTRAAEANVAETDEAMAAIRLYVYPDLVPPVIAQEGFTEWPPDVETFASLDEQFINDWAEAAYRLNPHWRIVLSEEEAEKKALT